MWFMTSWQTIQKLGQKGHNLFFYYTDFHYQGMEKVIIEYLQQTLGEP